jgi:RimJ/RimL family protein N-acetyltransferase
MKLPVNLHKIPALQEVTVCEGIKLRPLQQSDDTQLLKILERDNSIRDSVTVASRLHTTKDVADEIDRYSNDTGLIRYVIVRNDNPIGLVSLWRDDEFWGTKNLDDYGFGYFLDPNERGKGLITQALQCLIDTVTKDLHVNQFVAFCEDTNSGSLAVLKKLKFEATDETLREPNKGWIERKYVRSSRNIK